MLYGMALIFEDERIVDSLSRLVVEVGYTKTNRAMYVDAGLT